MFYFSIFLLEDPNAWHILKRDCSSPITFLLSRRLRRSLKSLQKVPNADEIAGIGAKVATELVLCIFFRDPEKAISRT